MLRSDIENSSLLFKQVPDGYVFRAPNPRIFGRADHYLVGESQKAEICAILTGLSLRRPHLVLTAWFTALLLGLVIFINFVAEAGTGGLVVFIGFMTAGIVLPPLYALHRYASRQLQGLQLILANAPRTDQQITLADIRSGVNKAQSFKQVALAAGLTGMTCLGLACTAVLQRNHKLAVYEDPLALQYLIYMIMFGLMTAASVRNAWNKIEPTPALQPSTLTLPAGNLRARLLVSTLTLLGLLVATGVVGIGREYSDLNQGLRYAENGETDKAIASFSKAIEADPTSASAYRNRAASFTIKSDHGRAVADYTRIIERDLQAADIYYLRGKAHWARLDGDNAVADFTTAIKLDPNRAIVYYYRGLVLAKKLDHDRAIADFTKAIESDPTRGYFYYFRAASHAKKSDHVSAIADFTQAIARDLKDGYAYAARARSYIARNDHDRAIADFTQAIAFDPKDGYAYAARARSYIVTNDPERALADYKTVVELPAETEAGRQLQQAARARIEQLSLTRLAPAQK